MPTQTHTETQTQTDTHTHMPSIPGSRGVALNHHEVAASGFYKD